MILKEILEVASKIIQNGHKAYLVGGGTRNLLLGKPLKDVDIATSMQPPELLTVFPESFCNNNFGTVGVKTEIGIVEITTFRKEGKYSDKRHPDKVVFAPKIDDDLKRRDFTINSLALDLEKILSEEGQSAFREIIQKVTRGREIIFFEDTLKKTKENWGPGIEGENDKLIFAKVIPRLGSGEFPKIYLPVVSFEKVEKELKRKKFLVDNFGGLEDLSRRLIRAVGNPEQRFEEDALRLLRAVRLACELGFKIEKTTASALEKKSNLLQNVSAERIRDELTRIIMSSWPAEGIMLLKKLGLLQFVIPCLEEGWGVEQNWHHIYSVFEHSLLSLKFCLSPSLSVRLAALFHDIAKPRVKRKQKGKQATFYFHEVKGERMTRAILSDLKFPRQIIDETGKLVRFHMFNFDHLKHDAKTVRRLLHRVGGKEMMEKLLELRIADRLGSGCQQGEVFKLRKLRYLIEKVSSDPISLQQVKVNGKDLMNNLGLRPGPMVGALLEVLLFEVIQDPKANQKEKLLAMAEKMFLAEKRKPGIIEERRRKAREFLEGKKEEMDLSLQEKYRIIRR